MEILSSYLKASNMTQAAFAEAIGVSQPTVHRWINRQAKPNWDKASEIEQFTDGKVPVSAWASHVVAPVPASEPATTNSAHQGNEVANG